jgi:hypothetical protein
LKRLRESATKANPGSSVGYITAKPAKIVVVVVVVVIIIRIIKISLQE